VTGLYPRSIAATHVHSLTQEISKCNRILKHCKAGFAEFDIKLDTIKKVIHICMYN